MLNREDYEEPRCPFDTSAYAPQPPVESVPIPRIIEKLDEHLGRNDYEAAEKLLLYWEQEAINGRDEKGLFSLKNEMMGLYRKLGRKDEALASAREALELMEKLEYGDTAAGGTCCINSATVYKAFGMAAEALQLFERAEKIYHEVLDKDDPQMGGLYNNMGLAMVDLGRYDEASILYAKALNIMEKADQGELECAITYLNMADAIVAGGRENADEQLAALMERAYNLLNSPGLRRDGYYAFVLEKCAPIFGYYGLKDWEEELKERAYQIYARS